MVDSLAAVVVKVPCPSCRNGLAPDGKRCETCDAGKVVPLDVAVRYHRNRLDELGGWPPTRNHEAVTNQGPAKTGDDFIERYCNLRHHVLKNVFQYNTPADCLCRLRNTALSFRDSGEVDRFIRAAVLEKIAEVKGRRRMGKRQRVALRKLP
jgi:hypothetical protein